MTDHDRARELAASALDFELSAEDRAELRAHLAGCAQCHVFNDGLVADAQNLSGLPATDAPDALRSRIVDGEPSLADSPAPDAGTTTPRRPTPLFPRRYRGPAALVASAAVVVALIGGMLAWGPRPGDGGVASVSPSPLAPAASGWQSLGPDASPGASGIPGAPGSPDANGDWHAVAALVPGGGDGGALELDSSFRLTSLDGTPPAELAARVRVDPPVAMAITAEPDGNGVRLTPSEPLAAGTVYRFTLKGADGETQDSWAFQTTAPLQVVSTLPEDHEGAVPLNTGIEITFDQDGVSDAASHVTIEPKTAGKFEQHGRVLAFVPDALKPGTIYTVTVRRGITAGPGAKPMADDLSFQFETDKAGAGEPGVTLAFSDVLFESGTTSRPIVSMWADSDGETAPPKSAKLDIYRLGTLDAAIGAYRQLRTYPAWAQWSNQHLVDTGPLTKVLSLDARFAARPEGEGVLWTALPEPLPAGWYLVEHPSKAYPAQSILQVTDIASYLLVTDTKTLLWTNDLATGGPLTGATAAVSTGPDLGPTDTEGLLTVATPTGLRPPPSDQACGLDCVRIVTVAKGGRSAFVPASAGDGDGKDGYGADTSHHWLTFATDRSIYRRTDTVNLWGMIRDRTTGKVPSSVVVRLQAQDEDSGVTGAPMSTLSLAPGPTGTFSGSVNLADAPEGWYQLELVVGNEVVRRLDVQVDRILKPAYRLEVETGHRAYVVGERIKATIQAAFFEGSPVPGVPLRVSWRGADGTVTTDPSGAAVSRSTARFDDPSSTAGPEIQTVSVSPRRAEEGQIQGASRDFLVFPSSRVITAESKITDGRVRASGTINALDRAGLERDLSAGITPWDVDPRGAPVAGASVTVRFVELIPVKTRTGTDYDFIEKKTVPVYEYTMRQRNAGSVRVRTDSRGRFAASVPAGSGHHDYTVTVRVADAEKLATELGMYATDVAAPAYEGSRQAALVPTHVEPETGYSVGSPIDLTLRDPAHPGTPASRYLFTLAQLGLRDSVVQDSPRYVGAFQAWAVPNVLVTAVRFTGSAYTSGEYAAWFDSQDRRIDVQLTPDKARFSPRDQVTVGVRTTDRAGKPIAASVVLRAIDEKLFVIGGAQLDDPLSDIYTSVGTGILSSYASHRAPPTEGDGGGDTTGGGGDETRDQFRDALLFKTVTTDADGRASASFRLSDDLTSWRILGTAFTSKMEAGTGSTQVAVGLPFFVDASIAPEYLLADRPTIVARAFGTALPSAARVTISASSPTLGLKSRPISAKAFADVPIRLPALTLGTHSVTITATYGSGASARTDRMIRTFTVVRSRLAATRTSYLDVAGTVHPEGGAGRTQVVVSDSSGGRYLPLLTELAASEGVRLERALAAAAAADLLTGRFGESEAEVPAGDFTGARYQQEDGGISLVPAGGSDLQVSALVALTDPDAFAKGALREYFTAILADPKATRERHIHALAGLAGLHATVLPQIQALADDDVTIRERLMLGLGAAALGDATTARSIARALISGYGEQQAGWARLRVGSTAADGVEGTALMAILAAATGEPLGPSFWAYVEANQMPDLVVDLHAISYVERLLERLPPRPASFAYTVDGTRTVVDLKPGETFSMVVTEPQLATLGIERLAGSIGVTTDWREPVKASTIERDPDITVTRSARPSGVVGSGDLVIVDFRVRFGAQAPLGCHLVTELVPSGLVAVGQLEGVTYDDEGEPVPAGVTFPFDQTAQRVSFCAENQSKDHVADLRYVARVITPGTYAWEPAVVESRSSADHGGLTGSGTVTIR